MIAFRYILIPQIISVLFADAYASCPTIPQCTCTKIKQRSKHTTNSSEEYRLKCSKIESVKELSSEFSNLANIITLDLEKNNIDHIEKGAFSGLVNLKTLILSNNKIKTISKGTFEGLVSLEILKLSHNYISVISNGTFSELKSLSKLNITGNPLLCDCNLYWLRSSNLKLTPLPNCYDPEHLRGVSFDKLHKRDFRCGLQNEEFSRVLNIFPTDNQIVFEGDSLHFSCKVTDDELFATDEESVLIWSWNNQDPTIAFNETIYIENYSDRSSKHPESSLTVRHLSNQHSGNWNCQVISNYINQSSTVNILVISNETKYCNTIVTKDNKGVYSWPQTIVGHKVTLPCQMDTSLNGSIDIPYYATYSCTENGSWTHLNTNECPYVSSITRILQQFSKMNLTYHAASLIESATRLSNFTYDNLINMKDPSDVMYITATLENYLQFLPKQSELGDILIQIVSHVLKLPATIFQEAQKQYAITPRFLKVVESITKYTPSLEFQNNNIAVKGFEISSETFSGFTCTWFKNVLSPGTYSFVLNCSVTNRTTFNKNLNVEASIQVPLNLFFQSDIQTVRTVSHHLMIAVFKDNYLFPEKNANSKYSVSSPIISANLIGVKPAKLDDPVYIILKNYHVGTNPQLAWWDSDMGLWIKEGCHSLPAYGNSNSLLIFQCYRMGYFALLTERGKLDITYESRDKTSSVNFQRLHPFIYIGTFVSSTCLLSLAFIYILLYSSIQMNRKMKHSKINTWISTSLFSLTYCIGIWQTDDETTCQIIGLSIHYFALSTFFWMAVTIKVLYKCVQKNNPTMSTPSDDIPAGDVIIHKPILGIYLVGYGISLILCGISGAVNFQGYAGSNYCFLTPGPALSTVLIPASLVLLYLLIMCLLVNCATNSLDSNAQLSVGTQAIDLELLDPGRVSLTHEHSSIRSVTTPSSQVEDIHHPPSDQLNIFIIYLILYILIVTSAACSVMLPYDLFGESENNEFYAFIYNLTSLCACIMEFACYYFHRSDVRNACCKLRQNQLFHSKDKVASNCNVPLPSAICSQPDPGSSNNILKPLQVETNSIKSNFPKAIPNLNLLKIHRQHYYRNNINVDNFYNPHQSIVAKKFFKKQRRKRNNIIIRKCRSGGSSPISTRLFDRSLKIKNTNMRVDADSERSKFINPSSDLKFDRITTKKNNGAGLLSDSDLVIPEYEEVPNTEDSSKYDQVYSGKYDRVYGRKRSTREQMCGTSDKDWCSYDTVSDVNSEPTYNYAFIDKVNNSCRSISDHSSSTSHLYATVAPDIITPPIAKCRNYQYVRNPYTYHNVTFPPTQVRNNFIFSSGPNSLLVNDAKKKKKENNSKVQKNNTSNDIEDKVETCV